MSLFRFSVGIFANLIMALAGGFLSYLGSIGLFTTLQVYLVLDQAVPGTGSSVNEALATANGSRLDPFADLTPWLILFGELFIGLPLLVFGILGLFRRLQSGLPDEEEDRPESLMGRFAQGSIYLAGGTVGLYLLTFAVIDVVDYANLEVSSEKAEAVVSENWKSTGQDGEQRGGYYASYSFQTRAGEIFSAKTKVPNFAGGHFAEGNRIVVQYLPSDPAVNEWEGARSFSDYALPLMFYLVLVIGGFWGLKRNFSAETQVA